MKVVPHQAEAHAPKTFFSKVKNGCVKTALLAATVYLSVTSPFAATVTTITSIISDRLIKEVTNQVDMPSVFQNVFQTALGIGSSRFMLMSFYDLSYQNSDDLFAATTVATGLYALQRGFMKICNKYFELG